MSVATLTPDPGYVFSPFSDSDSPPAVSLDFPSVVALVCRETRLEDKSVAVLITGILISKVPVPKNLLGIFL